MKLRSGSHTCWRLDFPRLSLWAWMKWSHKSERGWIWGQTDRWTDVPSVSEGLSSSLQLLAPAAAETGRETWWRLFHPNTWSCKTAHRGSVWFIKIRNSSLIWEETVCLHGTTFSCGLMQIWWIICALMEEHFSHWWIFRAFVRLTGLMWSFDKDEL